MNASGVLPPTRSRRGIRGFLPSVVAVLSIWIYSTKLDNVVSSMGSRVMSVTFG